jgi:hypothetical protein
VGEEGGRESLYFVWLCVLSSLVLSGMFGAPLPFFEIGIPIASSFRNFET